MSKLCALIEAHFLFLVLNIWRSIPPVITLPYFYQSVGESLDCNQDPMAVIKKLKKNY